MRRYEMRTVFGWVVTVLALAALHAEPALAQMPPDLAGEEFTASDTGTPDIGPGKVTVTSSSCTPTSGHISYIATGPATGPYTGTFWEAGTLRLGGPSQVGTPESGFKEIIDFEAHFVIHSTVPPAVVHGRKTLQENAPGSSFEAFCEPDVAISGGPRDPNAVTYEATIRTRTHRCVDRGLARVSIGATFSPVREETFSESFSTDGQLPVCRQNGRPHGDDDDD
jgi:hypothetical protein